MAAERERRAIPKGLLLQWHVTERCNLRCAHCYQQDYSGRELELDGLLDILRQYRELLGRWREEAGRRVWGHVTVTGGEPFVRKDFWNLLEALACHRERFRFAILTNGTLVDPAAARRLQRLRPSFVQVSVEGSRATHDRIRGAGTYDRAVSALRALARERIPTLISFTAHRGNFREFPEVARLGKELGVTRVWADRMIPQGAGAAIGEEMLTPEETRAFFEAMARAGRSARGWTGRGCEVAMHRALQFLVAGGTPYHCTAGDSLLTVQPDGAVYPCRRMPVRVGSLTESTLEEIYYGSDLLRALRDPGRTSEGCRKCVYAGLCRGGLKCLSYAVTGDPFEADPGCWHAASAAGTPRSGNRCE